MVKYPYGETAHGVDSLRPINYPYGKHFLRWNFLWKIFYGKVSVAKFFSAVKTTVGAT